MANPRVFVSSTYYDLKHVRNDIRNFLQNLGYEAVMHDTGNVAYTQDVSLEKSCYNELDTCNIVVCIIGNKYGTQSVESDDSITMSEIKAALRSRKKVFIYILKEVYAENFTYLRNKDKSFIPYHVDNIKIHEFIAELKDNVRNSPIETFDNVTDITDNLKQQFAGLFQHLLNQEATVTETKTYNDLQDSVESIKSLIGELSEQKEAFFDKFDGSIYTVRPALRRILKVLGDKTYTIFTKDRGGLKEYLSDIGFQIYEEDLPWAVDLVCTKIEKGIKYTLTLKADLFDDDGTLTDIKSRSELDKWILYTSESYEDEAELPF